MSSFLSGIFYNTGVIELWFFGYFLSFKSEESHSAVITGHPALRITPSTYNEEYIYLKNCGLFSLKLWIQLEINAEHIIFQFIITTDDVSFIGCPR